MKYRIAILAFWSAALVSNQAQQPRGWERVTTYRDERLIELSGLAPSLRREGVLWAHNDGGPPKLHALDLKGAHLGEVTLEGVAVRDWEDLASFDYRGRPYLLLADTGNNERRRQVMTLHVIEEPPPRRDGRYTGLSVRPAWSITFRYEDRPQDCEGVAVDHRAKTIYLVSKSREASVIYRLPLIPRGKETSIARVVARLPRTENKSSGVVGLIKASVLGSQATALDFSMRGDAAAVLTYTDVRIYRREPRETWDAAFRRQPRVIALSSDVFQPEALCFAPDGGALFVTSEASPAPLIAWRF